MIQRMKRAAKRRQKREHVRYTTLGPGTLHFEMVGIDRTFALPVKYESMTVRSDRRGMKMSGKLVPRPQVVTPPPVVNPDGSRTFTLSAYEFGSEFQ